MAQNEKRQRDKHCYTKHYKKKLKTEHYLHIKKMHGMMSAILEG